MTYTMGTLFSGIGVPDLAGRMLGMTTVWQVEKEPYAQKVLRKHFPEAVLHGDVFDCHNLPYVDVVVAGFPCQPFSLAGKRQGERDERYLVPEMLRIIREVKPHVVLFENVPGFASIDDGNTFKLFLRTLAEMGMHAEWGHLSAADFGAPHKRERWWCVAYTEDAGINRRERVTGNDETGSSASWRKSRGNRGDVGLRHVGHAYRTGRREQRRAIAVPAQLTPAEYAGAFNGVAYPNSRRREQCNAQQRGLSVIDSQRPDMEYTNGKYGHNGRYGTSRLSQQQTSRLRGSQHRRVESRLGRGTHGAAIGMDGFRGWPSRPGESQRDWEPARIVPNGLPNRAARLKALGNSMVLPVVYAVLYNIRAWLEAQDAVGSEVQS